MINKRRNLPVGYPEISICLQKDQNWVQSMAVNATDGYMKQEIVLVNDATNLNNRGRNHTKS